MSESIGIKAEYIGKPLYSYELPRYKDVAVYSIYQVDEEFTYIKEIGWVYERIMIQDNSFVFTIRHNSFYCTLIIPIEANSPSDVHALYLGPPVLIGTKYNTDKLYVDLLLKDGTIKVLKFGNYSVSGLVVSHTKNNIFEINYGGLTDKFFVYGYGTRNTVDLDFQLFIIHDNGYEEDVTDMFEESFFDTNIDKIYVTINRLDKTLFASNYRMILPKNSGMYQKYSTEWLVSKKLTTINATLNKVFYKEDSNE